MSSSNSNNTKTYAATHYPLEILGRKVHILNACQTYGLLLQQLVSRSNVNDLSVFVEMKQLQLGAGGDDSSTKSSSSSSPPPPSSSSPSGVPKSYFDIFCPSITTSTQHIPHGQMKRISLFRYIHPNGVKVMSAEAVSTTLKNAKMPYVTDLISAAVAASNSNSNNSSSSKQNSAGSKNNNNNNDDDDNDDDQQQQQQGFNNRRKRQQQQRLESEGDEEVAMFEQLRELPFTELDIARFCLCALWELSERNVFDPKNDGELTQLAKRDLKKALTTAAAAGVGVAGKDSSLAGDSATNSSLSSTATSSVAGGFASSAAGGAALAGKSVIGTGTAQGQRVQKNLRALLEEECAVAWPHTPVDKAVVFTIINDPEQPRHKPLFKATVEFPLLKKMKVEGEWAPTKRDAENSAADKSLPTVRRMLKK